MITLNNKRLGVVKWLLKGSKPMFQKQRFTCSRGWARSLRVSCPPSTAAASISISATPETKWPFRCSYNSIQKWSFKEYQVLVSLNKSHDKSYKRVCSKTFCNAPWLSVPPCSKTLSAVWAKTLCWITTKLSAMPVMKSNNTLLNKTLPYLVDLKSASSSFLQVSNPGG